jgi:hypothetical protein
LPSLRAVAKQSSAQCKRPLDCFVAGAPRHDARGSRPRDAVRTRVVVISNLKATKRFALHTDLRQRMPAVVTGNLTINASGHECKSKKKKESGTPKDADPYPLYLAVQLAPCKARSPIGVPPRFSPKGVIVPKAQLQARLPGTWSVRALPAFACPSPASTSRPGHHAGRLMPKPPGSGSDEPPPAGTASRSDQPGSPADVLHGERD